MNGDELSTKLSTGCGERTPVAVELSTCENTSCRELFTVLSVGSRRSVGVLASFVLRRSCAWNRPCQKLTVFSPSANSSATLR